MNDETTTNDRATVPAHQQRRQPDGILEYQPTGARPERSPLRFASGVAVGLLPLALAVPPSACG
jgi:hypothetical protein